MELIKGTHKASNFAPQDFISSMPDIVINNILDRLRFQDAVRTSVLSRNWRFKWTMLSQLVLDDDFFNLIETDDDESNHERIVSRLLVHLKGPITKFELSIEHLSDAEDINEWILFLSRKGIKDVTLVNWDYTPLELPTNLFSCLDLERLKLRQCYFNNPPPSFRGFPNLLSLNLCVEFEDNIQLGEFFTRCPLLEKLTMDDLFEMDKVNIVEIAKVENLKRLALRFHDLDYDETTITRSSTIFELLGSLPKLQELCLDFENCWLIEGVKKSFFTTFPCLKALKLSKICLDNAMKLSFAFELIRSSPNLQTLEITTNDWNADSPPHIDYNTTRLLRLQSVVFECLKGSENELQLIKYLLACSPFLESIVIYSRFFLSADEKLVFVRKLLKLYRASPVVEIELFWF